MNSNHEPGMHFQGTLRAFTFLVGTMSGRKYLGVVTLELLQLSFFSIIFLYPKRVNSINTWSLSDLFSVMHADISRNSHIFKERSYYSCSFSIFVKSIPFRAFWALLAFRNVDVRFVKNPNMKKNSIKARVNLRLLIHIFELHRTLN